MEQLGLSDDLVPLLLARMTVTEQLGLSDDVPFDVDQFILKLLTDGRMTFDHLDFGGEL